MADSDEAAFLASVRAENEAAATHEVDNSTGAVTESINTSDEYDPTQAVSSLPSLPQNAQDSPLHQIPSNVLLNETLSTSDISNLSAAVLHNSPDPPVLKQPDRQSESRSMSRATTSDGSQTLLTNQSTGAPPPEQTESTKEPATSDGDVLPEPEHISSGDPSGGLDSLAVTPLPGAEDVPEPSLQNDLITSTTSDAPLANGVAATDGQAATDALQSASKDTAAPSTIQGSTAAATTLPKARLPHDTIGILEDRIKDDPRGGIEAWLNLIAEYRKRSKLDEARSVYERFFVVFPAAVRYSF